MITTVEFTLESSTADDTFSGVITNASESGVCLLTKHYVHKAQKIIINNGASPLSRTAIVRWVEKFNSHYFAVGLEFV